MFLPSDRSRACTLFKRAALTTASALALATQAAYAQPAAQDAAAEEIIVTGSRIVRDGYEAPTPVSVISAEALAAASATNNLAESLNTMPVFSNSQAPATTTASISAGGIGVNALNLRSLGANRTLVLLDGQRSVGSLMTGVVDVNNFPQKLVSRVDVVSGGASAVYGSDALTGVVNFVLDREFVGVRGEVAGGVTTYGDNRNFTVALAGGFAFGGGRGHVLLSGEIENRDGVIDGAGPRTWNDGGTGVMTNPAYVAGNGQPQFIVRHDIAIANATKGGLIISGPLKGTAFGDNGVPYQFQYGTFATPWMYGGAWRSNLLRERGPSLEPRQNRHNLFTRVSYDITDNVNLFASAAWAETKTHQSALMIYQAGSGPTIFSGNPFIPAEVQARMTALGVTSFQIGSMNWDLPNTDNDGNRQTNRYVVGMDGSLDAFDTSWTWNAYYQYGYSRISIYAPNNPVKSRYNYAVDAIRDPVTGLIVCRNAVARSEGCVPWNPMGLGVNTNNVASSAYFQNEGYVAQRLKQQVWAGSITGAPFTTWAGPVSLAFSAEHRAEHGKAKPDPIGLIGDLQFGNFQPIDAGFNVSEAALEVVIPLAKATEWADSLDVSLAARGTDYSTSGFVTTWKAGVTYAPIPDIRFRATRSRDIRAPNLVELYQNNISGFASGFDPFTNTTPQYLGKSAGNPNLTPEIGDTLDIGVVVSPSFLPGFTASVDYWNIDLSDAIGGVNANQTMLLCFQGNTALCANIERTNGIVTAVTTASFNLASREVRGIDFDGTYRFALADVTDGLEGDITMHATATVYLKDASLSGLPNDPVREIVGNGGQLFGGPPNWKLNASVGYSNEDWKFNLTARAVSKYVIGNHYVQCTSGCPASTGANPTIDNNQLPGFLYFDASVAYNFAVGGGDMEAFFNMRNIFNKDPGIVPQGPTDYTYLLPLTRPGQYDTLGRVMRGGVRFKF